MVNAAMVNAKPRVSNVLISAKIFPFWAGFRTSQTRLNILATSQLTDINPCTEYYCTYKSTRNALTKYQCSCAILDKIENAPQNEGNAAQTR
jgi:hypothetical protein